MPPAVVPVSQEEKLVISRAYRKLLRSIKSEMSAEDKKHIRMAYEIAVQAHEDQRRKSGEPYILHPLEVARICAEEIGLGPTAIVCALLHDVVEDTEVSLAEIGKRFGLKIAKIVDGLTKLDGAYSAHSPQAENLKKVLSTLVEDVRVVLIKIADRLHNMRTLGSMPLHKQLRIAGETSYIYAPLAHRLGLYKIKTEFQDLSMKVTDPENYYAIAKKLAQTKRDRNKYIKEFITPLKAQLDQLGVSYRLFGRPKSIHSIYNKIQTKKVPFEEVYDIFAIRVIVDVERKRERLVCWQVYSVVTDVHRPIPERLKDWISTPKSNGYESLHTTVIGPKGRFVEVQIRSERMDEVAEKGFAAHWKYKGFSDQKDVFDVWLDNIRDILEQKDASALEFLNDFKTNLFQEEVYVYTPNGDLRILPLGATALDFAFSIHTDLGYRCKSVKVNNRLVPLGYKLQNGDQITVLTDKNQKPSENWLKMVVTSRARSKIRAAMKEEKRSRGILGKEALERKLRNMKLDFEENVDFLVKAYGFKSRPDLYYAIAMDQIHLQTFKQFDVEGNKLVLPKIEGKPDLEKETHEPARLPKKKPKVDWKPRLVINGEPGEQYNYTLASCCNPVLGDEVFAFITSSSGVKIHRTNCPNASHLVTSYGYRILKAEWEEGPAASFVADLRITGVDDGPGVIERLSQKISTALGLNIRAFYIDGNEGYFEGKVSIVVKNKDQLNKAIKALQKLNGISSVVRIK